MLDGLISDTPLKPKYSSTHHRRKNNKREHRGRCVHLRGCFDIQNCNNDIKPSREHRHNPITMCLLNHNYQPVTKHLLEKNHQ